MRRSIKQRREKGFTLIELVVVLAVLAIIMAIAVPMFSGVREQAKVDSDMATMASIAKLAEFEFVRLNMAKDATSFDDDKVVPSLIANNISNEGFFQSSNLKEVLATNVDVTFNGKGKVKTVIVNSENYTCENGKFSPPPNGSSVENPVDGD